MKRLNDLWGESWSKPLRLGTRVELARQRRLALDERQLDALDLLAGQDRALIQGGAGTGKTLLAVEAARRQAEEGRRVLLLCSTQPLAKWLRARLEGTGIQVETVSGLARTLAEQADGPRADGAPLVEADWKRFFERACELVKPEWDAVIIDEAQDFPFEAWALVEGLARGRRLWAFQDPGQCYWRDRVVPAELFGKPFQLRIGQRSPGGIEALAARYLGEYGDDKAIARAVAARELVLIECAAPAQAADKVGVEIERLLGEGIRPGDIGVVSLQGQGKPEAVFRAAKLGRQEFVLADADGMEERLVADSFLRWKGLERPVIIVADVDPAMNQFNVRMHIALTRAQAAVRIVAPRGDGPWPGLAGRP
jgi:superfamily I DNA and RNA helicase